KTPFPTKSTKKFINSLWHKNRRTIAGVGPEWHFVQRCRAGMVESPKSSSLNHSARHVSLNCNDLATIPARWASAGRFSTIPALQQQNGLN
ncbi:MAG: hypothetical protein JXR40_13180, partial [Pontiellaceae bacterium]|nr:hypothetical protein [Pontiellaceae bacterium]